MAKKQQRLKRVSLEETAVNWLGKPVSLVLTTGAVFEVLPRSLQQGMLLCTDHGKRSHLFSLNDIYEIILDFPVAEHAQTSSH